MVVTIECHTERPEIPITLTIFASGFGETLSRGSLPRCMAVALTLQDLVQTLRKELELVREAKTSCE